MKTFLTLMLMLLTGGILSAQSEGQTRVKAIVDAIECSEWGTDSVMTAQAYSLYREGFQMEEDKDDPQFFHPIIMNNWRYVFFNAPKLRQTTHINGIEIFKTKVKALADDDPARAAYIDTMLAIYDVRINCFTGDPDFSLEDAMIRKSFDWYSYRNEDVEFVYNLMRETYEMTDMNRSLSFYKPYIIMAMKAKSADVISKQDVLDIYIEMLETFSSRYEDEVEVEKTYVTSQGVTDLMKKYNYLDCESLVPYAEEAFAAKPDNKANLSKWYSLLSGAECTDAPVFLQIAEGLQNIEPNAVRAWFLYVKLRESDPAKAQKFLQQAIELAEDGEKKADYLYEMATIKYKSGSYTEGRKLALDAAKMKPNWGKPYILIGRMYAGSGSTCGPGTGWDSQVVVWPAIDKWNYAKSIDPSVAEEAQKLISQYWGYMPAKEDGFFREVAAGSSYTVGCWINESTTVRFSDQ